MTGSTRRSFLIASGAGAAVVGVAVAVPASAGANAASAKLSIPKNAQPLVAHISDPASGDISLLVGDREVLVHDHELVAQISRAAATEA
jgi:hypothetical protein